MNRMNRRSRLVMRGGGLPSWVKTELGGEDEVGRFVFDIENWYILKKGRWSLIVDGEEVVQPDDGHILILKTKVIKGVTEGFGTRWAYHGQRGVRYNSFKDYGWIKFPSSAKNTWEWGSSAFLPAKGQHRQ